MILFKPVHTWLSEFVSNEESKSQKKELLVLPVSRFLTGGTVSNSWSKFMIKRSQAEVIFNFNSLVRSLYL